MKIRHGMLLAGALALAGCSWMPHFGRHGEAKQQMLMKSLSGEVDYHLAHDLPPDAYLEVTLSDISKQDAPRVIATDRIAPIGPAPVSFVLSYEPAQLGNGSDFSVLARIRQGDRTLASSDTQTRVMGQSGNNGPVLIIVSELH